jgi:hypothetical protein
MIIRQLALKENQSVNAVSISDNSEIPNALDQLGIPHPKTAIVLVGGANGISWLNKFPMRKAVGIVAKLAEETGSVVIDGGTQAGVMFEIGRQRKQNKFSFPLIGVIHEGLLSQKDPQTILDSHHTHFILVPGNHWGDESAWIAKIATTISGTRKSITMLINGGNISRNDIEYSLLENRTTIITRGTGRLADEISLTGNATSIDISKNTDELLHFLTAKLS